MVTNGYVLGGEQSGHIIFSKYATTGDGLLTSLKIMETIIESKKTIDELLLPIKIYPQVLKNVPVTDKQKVLNDMNVKNKINEIENKLGNDGRVLVRPSGTEMIIRVMVEAKTEEECEKYVNQITDEITKINA